MPMKKLPSLKAYDRGKVKNVAPPTLECRPGGGLWPSRSRLYSTKASLASTVLRLELILWLAVLPKIGPTQPDERVFLRKTPVRAVFFLKRPDERMKPFSILRSTIKKGRRAHNEPVISKTDGFHIFTPPGRTFHCKMAYTVHIRTLIFPSGCSIAKRRSL